jgi:heavy metal translocating P-type ATPase
VKSKPASGVRASQGVRQGVVEIVGTTLENAVPRESGVFGGASPSGGPAKETPVKKSRESTITGIAVAGIVLHLILRFIFGFSAVVYLGPLWVVLVVGGAPLIFTLARKALAREFGSDLLAGISIVTAILLREYLVGVIVVLMLSGGETLERFATRRASSVLDALAKRVPSTGHRKVGNSIVDISLADIAIGDLLVVLPHEICPVDGVVVEGRGRMDEAYLTGEPYEISKTPGSGVLSGAINGETAVVIRAEKLPVDSRYARIMQVMKETEQRRPRMRRLGDLLGAWYTPIAVGVAIAAWIFSGASQRFLAVVVIATPCPLLLAIPVAIIGAISVSARRGIVIKNPAALEQIDRCRTLIFDKTGTLTYGEPSISEIVCIAPFQRAEVLRLAASLEVYSKHPLAGAVIRAAREEKLPFESVSQISERPGEGLRGIVGGQQVLLTSRKQLGEAGRELPAQAPGLECVAVVDTKFAALFRFRDVPRADSRNFLSHLRPRHAVRKLLLVSGDRESEVRYLADEVGIRDVHAGKSPEEKVEIVRAETRQEKTLFLGDGINDAPAMQAATVGVAFGHASDITAEAADAVVLEASLSKVDELIHISSRMRSIALQSAVGGMALSMVGMIAAAFGYLPPIGGAIAQEVIDLAAVLNAVRVAIPSKNLTDF